MRVLIGCESSGRVRDEFIKLGHDSWSCDLKPSRNGGNHYCKDIFEVIEYGWDLFIYHPPCTYLAVSGATHFKRYGREYEQDRAIEFVKRLWDVPIKKIALENPIGVLSTKFKKPDQIIQPYWFGDSAQKSTCLWLKNLPLLQPTKVVDKGKMYYSKDGQWCQPDWFVKAKHNDKEITREIRSITFPGIANAMAEQWGRESLFTKLLL